MTDLAALIRHPRWRWMPGMLTATGRRLTDSGEQSLAPIHAVPNVSDPATFGCLLALAAELHNAPLSFVCWDNLNGWGYYVLGEVNEQGVAITKVFLGETKEDAVCDAILGAP